MTSANRRFEIHERAGWSASSRAILCLKLHHLRGLHSGDSGSPLLLLNHFLHLEVFWRSFRSCAILLGEPSGPRWGFLGRRSADVDLHAAAPELAARARQAQAGGGGQLDFGAAVVTRGVAPLGVAAVVHTCVPFHGAWGEVTGATIPEPMPPELGADVRPAAEAEELLARAWRSALAAAEQEGARSVAVPAIGCGCRGSRKACSRSQLPPQVSRCRKHADFGC